MSKSIEISLILITAHSLLHHIRVSRINSYLLGGNSQNTVNLNKLTSLVVTAASPLHILNWRNCSTSYNRFPVMVVLNIESDLTAKINPDFESIFANVLH